MSVGIGPPQVSPDGKWVWDGRQWVPIPSMEPVVPEVTIPLWEQRPARSGPGLYQYAAVGAVLLVLLLVILNATNIISIPWPFSGGSPTVTMVHGSPKPLVSDYVEGDRFLNLSLAPELVKLGNTIQPLAAGCGGTLTSACLTALNASNDQMTTVLSVIAHGGIPPCIAVGMKQLQGDLQNMAGGLGVALHGYRDGSIDEVHAGIHQFGVVGASMQADGKVIQAELDLCPKVLPT